MKKIPVVPNQLFPRTDSVLGINPFMGSLPDCRQQMFGSYNKQSTTSNQEQQEKKEN
jgi:hypothetical protein